MAESVTGVLAGTEMLVPDWPAPDSDVLVHVTVTAAPVSASYSPTVSEPELATKRSEPDTTSPMGLLSPVTSEVLTVAPEVVYSPTVSPPALATKRSEPETAMPMGLLSPVTSEALTVAPEVVYSPTDPEE